MLYSLPSFSSFFLSLSCLHYTYLKLLNQPTARFDDCYVKEYGRREEARGLKNSTVLNELKVTGMALIDNNLQVIYF